MNPTGSQTPGLETWLLWSLLTLIGGMLAFTFFSHPFDPNPRQVYFWMGAVPLFWVSLGQWLMLRNRVAGSAWWLLIGLLLGFVWWYVYWISYGFVHEWTSGKSLTFGTATFWNVTWQLALLALIFGGIVGLAQGLLVLRSYGTRPALLWWVGASALAWGVGYPLGQQIVGGIFWTWFFPFPLSQAVAEAVTWGTIGMFTGAALIWLRRSRELSGVAPAP